MAFKLRSGNKTGFKNMGSSPAKHPHKAKQAHPSTGHNTDTGKSVAEGGVPNTDNPNYKEWKEGQEKDSPAKQRVIKGGEGQDQDKIFDEKGNHIGNWVNDKKVMFDDKPTTDPKLNKKLIQHQKEKMKARDEGLKKKKKSPAKQGMLWNDEIKKQMEDLFAPRTELTRESVGPRAEKKKRSKEEIVQKVRSSSTDFKVRTAYDTLKPKKKSSAKPNKAKNKALNEMLKKMIDKGFTPTKIADSFAIAKGGVTPKKKK